MASMPPITILFADQTEEQPHPVSNVCVFPERVAAERRVREAKRMVAKMEEDLINCDPRSRNTEERIRASIAPDGLAFWQEELRKAEAKLLLLTADDSMTYRGKQYRATIGAAGAN